MLLLCCSVCVCVSVQVVPPGPLSLQGRSALSPVEMAYSREVRKLHLLLTCGVGFMFSGCC